MPVVYVMGPSGAGKDAVIAHARARVDPARVAFAHRYITRPFDAGGENHVALSAQEFAARRDCGLLALWWESHGFSYGVGTEIDRWCAARLVVVVSGARRAWPLALQRYPDILGVLIDAPVEMRMQRLHQRAREDAGAVRERLATVTPPIGNGVQRLVNDGPLSVAGDQFVALLNGLVGTKFHP